MRIIHLLVIGALIFAAAYVYRIKMESTARVERVLRLRAAARNAAPAHAQAVLPSWPRLSDVMRGG